MKELVVLSGKGGTGKTSLLASLACLAEDAVLADCDVDAADLHLLLKPEVRERHDFSGGKTASVRADRCTGCGECVQRCRFHAIELLGEGGGSSPVVAWIDPLACEGCSVCGWICPEEAIDLQPAHSGCWYVSRTRRGTMVHAELAAGGENSGKLVTVLRERAREIAEEQEAALLLTDGSPGIGCPVIASITGSDRVLLVAEPTESGRHDVKRAAELVGHFGVPAAACVNKADLSPALAEAIRSDCRDAGIEVLGEIRYDPAVTAAQIRGQAVVETDGGPAAEDIRRIWQAVQELLA